MNTLTDINSVANKVTDIGNLVIALLISLAVIWIIINIFRYLIAGEEGSRAKGGLAILYGVIGLFVILSIWGLVAILRNTFRTQDEIPANLRNGRLDLLPSIDGKARNDSRLEFRSGVPSNYRKYEGPV